MHHFSYWAAFPAVQTILDFERRVRSTFAAEMSHYPRACQGLSGAGAGVGVAGGASESGVVVVAPVRRGWVPVNARIDGESWVSIPALMFFGYKRH